MSKTSKRIIYLYSFTGLLIYRWRPSSLFCVDFHTNGLFIVDDRHICSFISSSRYHHVHRVRDLEWSLLRWANENFSDRTRVHFIIIHTPGPRCTDVIARPWIFTCMYISLIVFRSDCKHEFLSRSDLSNRNTGSVCQYCIVLNINHIRRLWYFWIVKWALWDVCCVT